MSGSAGNLVLARSYLQAMEGGATGGMLEAFFARDVEFVVFPNLLVPQKATGTTCLELLPEPSVVERSWPSRSI